MVHILRNILRITIAIILTVVVAGIVNVSCPVFVQPFSQTSSTVSKPDAPNTIVKVNLKKVFKQTHTSITAAQHSAMVSTDKKNQGKANTKNIILLKKEVTDYSIKIGKPLPYEKKYLLFGTSWNEEYSEHYADVVQNTGVTYVANLQKRVTAWVTAVNIENARLAAIAKAAQIKAAQIEAAQKASKQGSTQGSTHSSGSSNLQNIVTSLPFTVPPIVFGSCSSTIGVADACFNYKNNIMLTPGLMRKSRCYIRRVIAHEYRHWLQWKHGEFKISASGVLLNRSQMEAEAYAFEAKYGC